MRYNGKYPLTAEQNRAVDLALTGSSLKIEAYAGAGKTSTLQSIAKELPGRGAYIAFNKSIADEAGRKFTPNVRASTAHSLAYRAVGAAYRDRLQARLTGRAVAMALDLRDWQILPPAADSLGQTLTAAQQGYLLIEFIRTRVKPRPSGRGGCQLFAKMIGF